MSDMAALVRKGKIMQLEPARPAEFQSPDHELWYRDVVPMLMSTSKGAVIDAAFGRVVDIRAQFDEITDAALAADNSVRGGDDLPLLSPPKFGLPGWWQMTDSVAVVWREVSWRPFPDSHDSEKWWLGTLLLLMGNPSDPAPSVVGIMPARLWLYADGERWDYEPQFEEFVSGRAPATHQPPELVKDLNERIIGMAIQGPVVTLLAASIMQADPQVVTDAKAKVPPKKNRGRRARTTTTIALPGLRYESGKWHAKTGAGVAWHRVRGHWRRLDGGNRRTWIRPHSRGNRAFGSSTTGYTLTR